MCDGRRTAAITAVLIVAIGGLLLTCDSMLFEIGDEHIVTPVAIALWATVVMLIGATVAAKTWLGTSSRRDPNPTAVTCCRGTA